MKEEHISLSAKCLEVINNSEYHIEISVSCPFKFSNHTTLRHIAKLFECMAMFLIISFMSLSMECLYFSSLVMTDVVDSASDDVATVS